MKTILGLTFIIISGLTLSACTIKLPDFLSKSKVPKYPDAQYQEDITGIVIDDIAPEASGSGIPPELLPVE